MKKKLLCAILACVSALALLTFVPTRKAHSQKETLGNTNAPDQDETSTNETNVSTKNLPVQEEKKELTREEKTRKLTFTSKGEDVMHQKFKGEFIIEDLEKKLSDMAKEEDLADEQKLIKESEITAEYLKQQKRVDGIKQLLKA